MQAITLKVLLGQVKTGTGAFLFGNGLQRREGNRCWTQLRAAIFAADSSRVPARHPWGAPSTLGHLPF